MARVTIMLDFCAVLLCIQQSSSTSSVAMPYCKTKQRCDEMWEAPNISDCINELCMCTRGSEYVERLQTCQCKDGHVVGNKGCLPVISELGSSCEESIQCTTLGELVTCDVGKCSCLRDALIISGTCYKKKYPNQNCTFEEECDHISKLVCLGDRCVCAEGHFLSPDERSCLSRLSRLTDRCQDDIQCTESFGKGSHCRGTCACKDGFREVNNQKCVLYRKENEECSYTADCFSDLKCDKGKCFRETGETTEKPAVTESRRNVCSLGCTPPRFLALPVLLLSLNVFMCVSRM